MKYYILGLVLCLILAGGTCKQVVPSQILFGKKWLHATEEDSLDIKVYRPSTYNFPPARGRSGFRLDKDGSFKLYSIAPTDGLEEHQGTWQLMKSNRLSIRFGKNPAENFEMELISVSENLLTTRFHSDSKK